jgi:trehalose-6-phosphate synthase
LLSSGRINLNDPKDLYVQMMNEVKQIHSKYGDDILHIIEPNMNISREDIIALYNASEVAVATSFWDGLNLMRK